MRAEDAETSIAAQDTLVELGDDARNAQNGIARLVGDGILHQNGAAHRNAT